MQVNAGFFPLSLHRAFGHAHHIGDLTEGKPAEKLQVNNLRQRAVHTRQFVESLANSREFLIVADCFFNISGEGCKLETTSSFNRKAVSHVIDNESPHDPRSIGHEAALVWEGMPCLRGHIEVSFVDECGGANAYIALTSELALGESMEFLVEKSKELGRASFVTLLCQADERTNVMVGCSHGIPRMGHSLSHFEAIVKIGAPVLLISNCLPGPLAESGR